MPAGPAPTTATRRVLMGTRSFDAGCLPAPRACVTASGRRRPSVPVGTQAQPVAGGCRSVGARPKEGAVSEGWVYADAWVLAAIGVYQRPCTLLEVIGAADWVNHAVPLEDEVESALGKLTGAGLVRIYEEWTFELTDEGASLWSEGAGDLQGQLIEAQLAAFEPGRSTVKLPRGVMDQAL